MQSKYNAVFLSPHLDDAIFSCGGTIYTQTSQGKSVLLVTVTAGDPTTAVSEYAQSLHDRWKTASSATSRRRQEDRRAAEFLQATPLHWPVPDCIYRHDPGSGAPMYLSDPDIFGPIHPGDSMLRSQLEDLMAALPAAGEIFLPLGIGRHVDHLLTRRAAEASLDAERLIYYEDFPYAQETEAEQTGLVPPVEGWQALDLHLSESAVAAKIEAMAAYDSQLSTFGENRRTMAQEVRNFANRRGGERFWRREPPASR